MEPIVEADNAQPVAKEPKKRSRAKKPSGDGVRVVGQRFVCTWTGQLIEKAIVPTAIDGVAFVNLPCAWAWIHSNVKDEDARYKLLESVCEQYQQDPAAVVLPLAQSRLFDLGGDQPYDAWMPNARLWDRKTDTDGTDVATYQARAKKAKSKGSSRAKKPVVESVTLEPGLYLVKHQNKDWTKAFHRCDAIEGAADDARQLTPSKVHTPYHRFLKTTLKDSDEQPYAEVSVVNEAGDLRAFAAVQKDGSDSLPTVNAAARKCFAYQIHGPLVLFVTKKHVVK